MAFVLARQRKRWTSNSGQIVRSALYVLTKDVVKYCSSAVTLLINNVKLSESRSVVDDKLIGHK